MSREAVQELISLIPEEYMEILYKFMVTLVPDEEELTPEELKEFDEAWQDLQENGGITQEELDREIATAESLTSTENRH